MTETTFDLLVIGGGPGGYVAALRAAQLGLKTAVIEERATFGGTCLNVGCIPSKALLESSHRFAGANLEFAEHGVVFDKVKLDLAVMQKRKDAVVSRVTKGVAALLWKRKVKTYNGRARLAGPGQVVVSATEEVKLTAKNIIVATGSVSASLPGIEFDGKRIGTSTEALAYDEVPKHLVVIGAGAIGLELGSVWSRLGAKVTVLEYLDRILPGMDLATAKETQKVLESQGLTIELGVRVTAANTTKTGCTVKADGRSPLRCSHVLVAVGRKPYTEGLGLDTVGIAVDERGRIPVNEHFATTADGIYAIGDVIQGPMLAHKASDEAVACVERIVTGYGHVNYDAIPSIVYTWPEVASVGKTEEELKEAGVPYRKGAFPFLANGRAHALGDTAGQVKILAHKETDRILGVHIIGPHAGDLIAEAAVAIEFGASSEDLARACHAHPTLAESLKEAALAVDRRALHI
jgi:dihydrolipoamide dehydrogenase